MWIRLLGPVAVLDADGRELLPAGPRVQGLLARLALDAGRPVDAATLVDALWGEDPPSTANALQSLASRLRRALGAPRLRASSGGYVLEVAPDDVDALRFAALRRGAADEPDGARARALLTEALALWGDPVLGGVRDLPFAGPAAARLADARAAAAEDLAARGLAGGVPDAARDVLSVILDEHPLRETTAVALARGLNAGGRRADALAVLDRTRAALADELGVDPGPALTRARTEVLQDGPPAAAPARTNGHRPRALTSFVGRDDDLARLRALTRTSRLVTVTGPGGAGKTRLAREAARDLAAPVAVVELAPLTGADQLAPAVLHAVGGPELVLSDRGAPDALPDAMARLRVAVSGRDMVLLLDNCEHLVDAVAGLVDELLTAAGGLVVLATSREPLGVPGEVLHPLGALDDAHAMRLFAERAAAVRPGFTVGTIGRDADVVRDICRRLDGQPLPIELAAARVRSLEPAEIADRLADRFRLLVSGSRTALPRHQTLRAVVDWSWDLLSDAERRAAARFGVFAGAVDARTVEAVCGDPDGAEGTDGTDGTAFDLLDALVEKSLVVAVPAADDGAEPADRGPTRYRMLETIREYAAARLAASPEHDAVVDAHAAEVLAVLEAGEPRLRTREQLEELVVVRRTEGEAVRALERAVADRRAARAHRLLAALTWSWVVRGDMATLMRWSSRVAELPAPEPDMAVAVNRSLRTVLLASGSDSPSSVADAEAEAEAVAAIRPGLPRPWHPLVTLHGPAVRAFSDGDRADLVALADGDGDAGTAGDPWLRAAAALAVATQAENVGEPDVQRRHLRAAHDLFSSLGDRFGLGMTTFALGELEDVAGDRPAARRAYLEAIALNDELHNSDDVPRYRMALAALAARDGDAVEARAQLAEAEAAEGPAEPWMTTWLSVSRADVERRLGRADRALALLAGTRPDAHEPGPGRGQREAMACHVAAAAFTDLGRFAEARERLEAAARAAQDSDDGPVLGQVAEAAARWALATDDAERAGELLGVALTRRGALQLGDPEVVATRDGVRARLGPAAADLAIGRGRARSRDVPPFP